MTHSVPSSCPARGKRPSPSTGMRLAATVLALTAAVASLSACAPLVIGSAAVGGTMLAMDRRTTGTQVEDKSIELKARSRLKDALGERGHVNVNAYNRVVLLTGEVQSADDKAAAEQAVLRIDNVRQVINELAVAGNSSLSSRSSDVVIETKVRATFVDARDVMSNAFKIVVERGEVFLMGKVTEREASRATDLAGRVSGVLKVVRVFEIISEEELARITPPPAKPADNAAPAR